MSKSMLSKFILALAPKFWAYKLWRINIIIQTKRLKNFLPLIIQINFVKVVFLGNTLEKVFQKKQLQEPKDHLILLMRMFVVQLTQAHMERTNIFYFSLIAEKQGYIF